MDQKWYLTEAKFIDSAGDDCFDWDEDKSSIEFILETPQGKSRVIKVERFSSGSILYNYFFVDFSEDLGNKAKAVLTGSISDPLSLASAFRPILAGTSDKIVLIAKPVHGQDINAWLMTLDLLTDTWYEQDISPYSDDTPLLDFLDRYYLLKYGCRYIDGGYTLRWGESSDTLYIKQYDSAYLENTTGNYELVDLGLPNSFVESQLQWKNNKWEIVEIRSYNNGKLDPSVSLSSLKVESTEYFEDHYCSFDLCLPKNHESHFAITKLNQEILVPVKRHFGIDKFKLAYGYYNPRNYLSELIKKDPGNGEPYAKVLPAIDQHVAMERNSKGKLICKHEGAACDFKIDGASSSDVVDYIVNSDLPFDTIFVYERHFRLSTMNLPMHISYGPKLRRQIWIVEVSSGQARTKLSCKQWLELADRDWLK